MQTPIEELLVSSDADRTVLLVLGMHRSGTSATTRVFSLLGADLPKTLVPAVRDNNETGFWESVEVCTLNDELLQSAGSTWDDWRAFNADWYRSPSYSEYRRRAQDIIKAEFSSSRLIVLKDPRICRIIPFWLDVLRRESFAPLCVIPVRNPVEVASSLRKRDGFSAPKSHALWLRHALDAEAATRGLPRVFIAYDELLDDWRTVVATISNQLDLGWPRKSATSEVEIDDFLQHRCRHHHVPGKSLADNLGVADWVRVAYDSLIELTKTENSISALANLDQLRHEFDSASSMLGAILRASELSFDKSRSALEEQIAGQEAASEEQKRALELSERRLSELESQLAERTARSEEQTRALELSERRLSELESQLAERTARSEEQTRALELSERRLSELESQLAERTARSEEQTRALELSERRLSELESQLAERTARSEEQTRALELSERRLSELESQLAEQARREALANQRAAESEQERSSLHQELASLRTESEQKSGRIAAFESSNSKLSGALAREHARADALQQQLRGVVFELNERQSGAAWLLSQRLHRLERRWTRGFQSMTKVPKVLWWTASLKLPERLKRRRNTQLLLQSGLFDEAWYVERNHDVVMSGYRPLIHWLNVGCSEGRDPNEFFDTDWYLQQYPEVADAGLNPLLHYLTTGAAKGYDPGPRFTTSAYLSEHPELADTGVNPLAHLLLAKRELGERSYDAKPQPAAVVPTMPSSRLQQAQQIAFSETIGPLVSIIIPVYNQVDLTLQCLASIVRTGARVSFEVIVIDDCSTDDTVNLLPGISGLRFARNEKNQGFTLSCNRGASIARGKYLCFLNNDTVVNDCWLDELVSTFSQQPNTGLVGAKLVYPNGRMQEAGGLIWSDGSGCNVGRDDDPDKPEFNYLREVDYCSGACILIERDLFGVVGGFDERYAPAYYEDTDLAFKVREQGLRVLFQPFSVITHHEGGTAGTDLSQGAKRYQVINQAKFLDRWRSVLSRHGDPSQDIALARDRWVTGRSLVVDVWPLPDKDSGSIDTVNLLEALLTLNYKVTFLPANTLSHFGTYTTDLQRAGVECVYAPYTQSIEQFLTTEGSRFNVVFLRRVEFGGKYLELVRRHCPGATLIFDTVDLHYLREQRRADVEESWEWRLSAAATKELELEYVRRSDATIVVSQYEKMAVEREIPDANVWWLPFWRDIPGRSAAYHERSDILFVGGFLHQPNVDAVRYFLESIWPLVTDRLPQARFLILGSNMPEEFKQFASPSVVPVGFVSSLTPHLGHCRLTIAPLRYGAGIKGKIITSMSHGVPVIATPLAIEGMGCTDGEDILVGDAPSDFADAIVEAYTNEQVWLRLSDNGLALVGSLYSRDAGHARLASLLGSFNLPASLPRSGGSNEPKNSGPVSLGRTARSRFDQEVGGNERRTERVIAFYLPQYHPIHENDLWWGKGFTEWSNVTKARPLFPGHYQPHLPSELGFYDLRVPETREAQAALAREYGVYGFCYYHYWFSGKRLLERPFSEVLSSGKPDFPFCLCWANENWTRRWDGRENQVLIEQSHTPDNDHRFFKDLIPALRDERYIRVDGRPLLLVYRTELLPDPKRTAEIWREESIRAGLGDLYLCRAESFAGADPREIGFDAAYEFPPLNVSVSEIRPETLFSEEVSPDPRLTRFKGKMFPYDELVDVMCKRDAPAYTRFRGAMVAWDNTARRGHDAYVWLHSSPELFERWISNCIEDTRARMPEDERIIFVNAWNEWAEGCHLEPDQRYGRFYLEALRRALRKDDLTLRALGMGNAGT